MEQFLAKLQIEGHLKTRCLHRNLHTLHRLLFQELSKLEYHIALELFSLLLPICSHRSHKFLLLHLHPSEYCQVSHLYEVHFGNGNGQVRIQFA